MTTDHHNEYDTTAGTPADHSLGLVDGDKHTARAVRWLWDTAPKGGVCLALILRLSGGEEIRGRLYFDTDQPDKNGRTAADRSMEALRAMGLAGDLDTIDEDVGGLDQGDVEVVIKIKDNGYPEAKYINAPRSAASLKAFAPPAVDAKRAFFAQMKQRAAAAGMGAKATGTAPAAPAQARPAAPAQRPAPQPTRGPGSPSRASTPAGFGGTEDVPDFSVGADDCPF